MISIILQTFCKQSYCTTIEKEIKSLSQCNSPLKVGIVLKFFRITCLVPPPPIAYIIHLCTCTSLYNAYQVYCGFEPTSCIEDNASCQVYVSC